MKILPALCALIVLNAPFPADADAGRGENRFPGIIPRPRQASYGEPTALGAAGVIRGAAACELEILSAEILAGYIAGQGAGGAVPVLTAGARDETGREFDTVFIVGTPGANNLAADIIGNRGFSPPDHPEGYIIKTFHEGGKNVVLAAGEGPRGVYYAVQSLGQLLAGAPGSLIRADIRDYPAFGFRISGNDEALPPAGVSREAVEWLSRFKFNGWAAGQSYVWPPDWRRMPEAEMKGFMDALAFAGTGAIDVLFQVHPFGRMGSPARFSAINAHSGADVEALFELIQGVLDAGASGILLRADDFHELSPGDAEVFGSKALAHSYLINRISGMMNSGRNDAALYFCPPYYTGEEAAGPGRDYFAVLRESIPEDVRVVWTGPVVCSFEIDAPGVREFRGTAGRDLLLWDNTVFRCRSDFGYRYEYAFYLFHPLVTRYPAGFEDMVEGIRYNYGYDGTEISRIANMTLADFLWNPGDYSPGESLRKAISLSAGPDAVGPVLEFAGAVADVFDLYHSPARIFSSPAPPGEEGFLRLLERVGSSAENPRLVEELEEVFRAHRSRIRDVSGLSRAARGIRTEALYSADHSRREGILSRLAGRRVRLDSRGEWSIRRGEGITEISFPFETPSCPGAFASAGVNISVPDSGTGRYYLAFVSDDDYRPGPGEQAWDGYLFRQVLVNGEIVWERDIAGESELKPSAVEITGHAASGGRMEIEVRGYDKKGVHNLGARMSFSELFLLERLPEFKYNKKSEAFVEKQ